MIYRRIVTFGDADKELVDYLDAMPKGQRSNYIRGLIRQDKNGESLDERIRKIVAEQMQHNPQTGIENVLKGVFSAEDEIL